MQAFTICVRGEVCIIAVNEIPSFEFDDSSDLPMWVQLRDRMAYLINSGYYKPGEKLPTVRKYAASLNIAYNTVSKAYMGLERDGYVTTVRGSGVFVKNRSELPTDDDKLNSVLEEFVSTCLDEGLVYDDIPQIVTDFIRIKKRDHEEKKEREHYT